MSATMLTDAGSLRGRDVLSITAPADREGWTYLATFGAAPTGPA